MPLNENNIQAPFQYKIGENTFELLERNGELELNTNNVQVKVFSGQRLFCADIGYAVDGPLENMEFLIDDIKVYPQLLENLKDLQTVDVKDNEIYLVNNDINFKSIIFFPPSDLNKNFKFNITTYSSTFSAFMFDEIAKKLNTLDTNYPVKNYYENTDYKVNDIIKNNGYLYRVFKDFTSDDTDYYLKSNCNLITPFKKLELDTDYKANELIEYENNFFIVQEDFSYNQASGPLTNLNGLLKPLQDIIVWFDGIAKIYKNQIIIKNNFSYIVLEDIENPVWGNIQKKIDYLNKASNTFYDDTNSGFGNNTNTVQKAIEKLKSGKQDSLTAGNNINLNGSNISVIGGTNKEYVTGNNYYIDDLIIYDSKLYKVNENFTATDWSTDRAKLTLISSGGGGATAAIDVSYDNSKTNLEYISGYDFPKFKTPIPDTINLVLYTGIAGTIVKQEDQSYRLQSNLNNIASMFDLIAIPIVSIENETKQFGILNILLQFFDNISFTQDTDFSKVNFTNLELDECSISEIESSFKFALVDISSAIYILIKRQDDIAIPQSNYTVNLNIKNRVLRNQDINIFGFNYNFSSLYNLTLINNNANVKLTGSFTALGSGTDGLYFYNTIIENYFNLIDDLSNLKATYGITSSSGKAVKFGISKISGSEDTVYMFLLAHQDDTDVEAGEIFTFNLTPDKNSTLDTVYSPVANVQQAIEIIVLNKIMPIGSTYIQFAEDDGTFDASKSPEKLFGGTWQLKYNTESVFFRTEGSLSEEGRSNGIQQDAMQKLTGTIHTYNTQEHRIIMDGTGCFSIESGGGYGSNSDTGLLQVSQGVKFDNSKQARTSTENRTKNRKIRIYKRIA
ncbi:phage tail protein [Brachyspira intermedia]|uniref:phage tail protein n=1 Tax=Brachyspira intermedia TaxID=84377 RepID=UPI0030077D10